MHGLQTIIKSIFALIVASIFVIAAAPASASPGWQLCTTAEGGGFEDNICTKEKENGGFEWSEVTGTEEVTSSTSNLELTDTKAPGGASTLSCSGTDKGWVGQEGNDGEAVVTATKCVRVTGACESNVTVSALHLPWSTKLEEPKEGQVRDVIKNGGNGEPGYRVECTTGGIFKIVDECTGKTSAKTKNNEANGTVEAEFDASSEKGTCSLGGASSGEILGVIIIKGRKPLNIVMPLIPEPKEVKVSRKKTETAKETVSFKNPNNFRRRLPGSPALNGSGLWQNDVQTPATECKAGKLAKKTACTWAVKFVAGNEPKGTYTGTLKLLGVESKLEGTIEN